MHSTLQSRRQDDRRKYPRSPMNGALDLRAQGIELPIRASLRDISAGGCAISARIDLAVKHPLRIELPIPGTSPLVLEANIVRATVNPAEKINHYGVRFRLESAALRDNLITYISRYCHPTARVHGPGRRSPATVDAKFMVTVSAPDVRPFNVMAIALGTGGMRLASDRVLRQEWSMKLDLKLPGAMIGAPVLTVAGRAKLGAKAVRGSYVQDVEFVEPSLRAIAEIERAMRDVAQKSRRAS
jgi:hypothetical protein